MGENTINTLGFVPQYHLPDNSTSRGTVWRPAHPLRALPQRPSSAAGMPSLVACKIAWDLTAEAQLIIAAGGIVAAPT